MQSHQIRESFLRFFEAKGHQRVASSSLVPQGDPTLLFANAGMNQFKNVFLGLEKRAYDRAVTVQKVVRAGGKHNDLDDVGRTQRHQTFFEMLGNFSFGDYFKRDAIAYAWELITEVWRVPKEPLWITIYEQDDEAFQLWQEVAGVPASRIIRLGAKDNFWEMADTGPCGPNTEIFVDLGEEQRCDASACGIGACDCDRWREFWNLVFMQFNRDITGKLTPLPRPSVDTGMGLERMATVLQGVESNWDTDLLRPLIDRVAEMSGVPYADWESGFPHRVIADHARCCAFLIADGVLPGNEGRGYVLRRILRRGARYGRKLGFEKPFLANVAGAVVDMMAGPYPDLAQRREFVLRVIQNEEVRFSQTLASGLALIEEIIGRTTTSGGDTLPGDEAFRLYDTFGFPLELTEELAEEAGLRVGRDDFDAAFERQRQLARASAKFGAGQRGSVEAYGQLPGVEVGFLGYDRLESDSAIIALVREGQLVETAREGDDVEIVLRETPFYAESGGQVGDAGTIAGPAGRARVEDTQRPPAGPIVHRARVEQGHLSTGDLSRAHVDAERRADVMRHHTATHLLHHALRRRLGTHVQQAGSLVAPDRLRFDFTHFAPLTGDELRNVEREVNDEIRANLARQVHLTSYQDAVRRGAMALFGERYGDVVRVVEFGDVSRELCGGTHVGATGEIGAFVVVSEGSVASGVRRIEALAGRPAEEFIRRRLEALDRIAQVVHSRDVEARVVTLAQENEAQRREIERLRQRQVGEATDRLLAQARPVDGVNVLAARVEAPSVESLRTLGDQLRARLGPSVVALGAVVDGKPSIVVMVTPGEKVHAGDIARRLGEAVDGKGGGRPDVAQAGGKDPAKIDDALALTAELVRAQTGGG